ncbi:MAG: hypothetical protein Q9195_005594 [Heterodermia aff. obscurata]
MNFVPRKIFPTLDSLPKSYFLGHHHAGLQKMKAMCSNIDLIVECRDYRVPITSRNPLFEESFAGKEKIIVYTKTDLGVDGLCRGSTPMRSQTTIRNWHYPSQVIFRKLNDGTSIRLLLKLVGEHAAKRDSLMALKMMVVGMPNVGKSKLLNDIRWKSCGKGKAAQTGDQPGVTRKLGSAVKIIDGGELKDTVYMIDTPGVFIPYVPNSESMLKLTLCGCVKDNIISPTILADYLLYCLNRVNPELYSHYHAPTNDVDEFLAGVARKTGLLRKGGETNEEASALWIIKRWRDGHLGRFVLDDVSLANFEQEKSDSLAVLATSVNQAQKLDKKIREQPKVAG